MNYHEGKNLPSKLNALFEHPKSEHCPNGHCSKQCYSIDHCPTERELFKNLVQFVYILSAICLYYFQITGETGEIVDSAPTGEQIVEAKEEGEGRKVQDLPILVLLDLPEPEKDQTEEELVESFLNKTFDLPQSSVKTAFRLPIRSNGMYLLFC